HEHSVPLRRVAAAAVGSAEVIRLALVAALALAPGCAHVRPADAGVAGTRDDVKTAPGEKSGYLVRLGCRTRVRGDLAVVGTGARPGPFQWDYHEQLEREQLRARVLAQLGGLRSIHSSGFGGGCASDDLALHVYLSDWRE